MIPIVNPPALLHVKDSLRALALIQTNTTDIPDQYFEGLSQLVELRIKGTGLTTIPNLTAVADTIEFLSLNMNCIYDTSNLNKVIFPRLRCVDLSYNSIASFDISYSRIIATEWLFLNHNALTHMDDPSVNLPYRHTRYVNVRTD